MNSPKWKATKQVSDAAMSPWGRKVMWLRSERDLSYRHIATQASVPFYTLYRMATDPAYEPKWGVGCRFIAFYESQKSSSCTIGTACRL